MSDTFTLRHDARLQLDIRKSRFLAQATAVESPEAALAFVARVGVPDATHNCWAYRVGTQYRFSDDGEPGGSAGRPILLAIEGQAVDRVAVVVTRWYGGIKLGVGGLARAYGGCAAECLRIAEKDALVERVRARIRCNYAAAPMLYARLREFEAAKVGENASVDGVELDVDVPAARVDALATFVRNLTRGRGVLEVPLEQAPSART
ncbi:MAG: YigZ family protein [Dokdonella sp.]